MAAAATPPVALAPDDPWAIAKTRFLRDLEPAERQLYDNATLENLLDATNAVNRDDAENSKSRTATRKLGPLISAIESYGAALDTIAQTAPLYLAPIWGSIRVVLVVAKSYVKFYDRIVDNLSRIGDVLPRFRDYERIYDQNKHRRLYQSLSNAYLEIILLCTQFRQSIKTHQTSRVRRVFKPLSSDIQFDQAVARFRRHKENVEKEATACHLIEAAEQRDSQLVLLAAEKRRKLLSKLSKVDCRRRHAWLKELQHEGTGVWLTMMIEYQQWHASRKSSVLCCYGIPGCGKSVIVSSVVDALATSRSTMVFYYCNHADKRTLEPVNIIGTLARELLGKVDPLPETLTSMIEQLDHDGERLTSSGKALELLLESLKTQIHPIYFILDGLDEADEEYQKWVHQALDRCLELTPTVLRLMITGREELKSQLQIPVTVTYHRILVSPTAIAPDIESYVRSSTKQRISRGTLVVQDPALEDFIVTELVKGAKGMFLWVEFQLNALCEAETDAALKQVLLNLPKNLSETYDRLLDKIEGTERRNMIDRLFKWIVCAGRPMCVSELREGIAFTLLDEEWDKDKIVTDFHRIVRACSNLVIVDEESQIVQLAHYTVEQYLLKESGSRFHFTMNEAHCILGEVCIAYLNFSNFDTQITRYKDNMNTDLACIGKVASNGPFLTPDQPGRRVVQAWNALRHPGALPKDLNLQVFNTARAPKNLDMSSFALLEYSRFWWLLHTRSFQIEASEGSLHRRDQLFRKLALSRDLLFDFRPWGEGTPAKDQNFLRALLGWALRMDHLYLIRNASAPVSTSSHTCILDVAGLISDDWTNLLWKHNVGPSYPKLPRALMDEMDAFAQETSTDRASIPGWIQAGLVQAVRKGFLNLIPADLPDEISQHLYIEAVRRGDLPTVKALQRNYPYWKVLMKHDGVWLNPLEFAVLGGERDIVMYLGYAACHKITNLLPDIHAFFQRLHEAVEGSKWGVFECLFRVQNLLEPEFGKKDPIEDSRMSHALIRAIDLGREDMVTFMLNSGVNPNSATQDHKLAIIEAIKGSHQGIVETLLQHGACVGPSMCGLPLTIAASLGRLDLCRLLVRHGAEVFGGNYSEASTSKLVSVYMEPGRKPDIWFSPTPLYVACYHGHIWLVKYFVDAGAAVDLASPTSIINIRLNLPLGSHPSHYPWTTTSRSTLFFPEDGDWETPIKVAARKGHHDVVEILTNGRLPFRSQNYRSLPEIQNIILSRWASHTLGPWSSHIFQLLVRVRAHPVTMNAAGTPVYLWALENNQPELQGQIIGSLDRSLFLHAALIGCVQKNDMTHLQHLLDSGADIFTYNDLGVPILAPILVDAVQSTQPSSVDLVEIFKRQLRRALIVEGSKAATQVLSESRPSEATHVDAAALKLQQIIKASITHFSDVNTLPWTVYQEIMVLAAGKDSIRGVYGFLPKLFNCFSCPSSSSCKPLALAMDHVRANNQQYDMRDLEEWFSKYAPSPCPTQVGSRVVE